LEPGEYQLIYQKELDHWWYQGMRCITKRILENYSIEGKKWNVLDVGCGTGGEIITTLAGYGSVVGLDLSRIALRYAKQRNIRFLSQASVDRIPFPSVYFDLITSFDVLYEDSVIDDQIALYEIARVLKPGGLILLRVPAYDWLRGDHDRVVHTSRRYSSRRISYLLQASKLKLIKITYANTIMFPFAVLKRVSDKCINNSHAVSDVSIEMGWLENTLKSVLCFESHFIKNHNFPYGLSVISLAQKA
jgi:SAM-dependent methyltransferase